MKRVYISELQNIRPQFEKDFYFGQSVKIRKMTSWIKDIADQAIGYKLNFFKDRWAIFSEEPNPESMFIDGDPSGGIRFIVSALLLYFGDKVRFGPLIHLNKKPDNKYEIIAKVSSGIYLDKPWPFNLIELNKQDAENIKSLFENLIKNYRIDLFVIPFSIFMRICEINPIPYEAVLLSITAMETLFLKGENEKAKTLARRCAAFLGSNNELKQNDIFREIYYIYRIRNAIAHEGILDPITQLSDNSNTWCINCKTAKDTILKYLRDSLVSILKNPPKNKPDFLKQLDKSPNIPFNTKYKFKLLRGKYLL